MRHFLIIFCYFIAIAGAFAGEPKVPDAKALAQIESGPLYLGSINSGFKVSEDYFDANLNLVAPVWSSFGTDGILGGGVLFLEPYVSWGENGEVATSLGLGYRYLFNDQPVSALRSPREDQAGFWDEGLAIGANFFVDLLDTEADNRFWQLGFGLEVATRYVEFRGNYYLPLSDRQLAERRVINESRTSSRTTTRPVTQTGAPYDNGQGFLVQDQTTSLVATTTTTTTLIRHIFERYEEGMEGWDAEIALLVPGLDKYCDVKLIGGYFSLDNSPFGPQKGGTGNVEGWKAGLEVRPVPAVALTGMWYEDERFLGSDWMFGARMEIPFEAGDLGDGKGMWGRIREAFTPRRRHLVERMAEPVHRQNAAIHIANTHKEESKVANQSTSSSTQVVSQTKNKIVLGPGPSGTDFTYASSGSLTVDGVSVSGSLYLNKAGQSVFVPDGGGNAVLFSKNIGAAAGTVNQSLVGNMIHVSGNVFLNNASVGSTLNLTTGGTTHFVPLYSTASGRMSIAAGITLNNNSSAVTNSATLNLGGTNTLGGITTVNSGILNVTNTFPNNLLLGGTLFAVNGVDTRVFTITNGTTTEVTLNGGTQLLSISGVISGTGSLIKSGAGTLILNGANTYSGTTTVNAGTLVASSWASLGLQTNVVIGGVNGTGAIVLPQGDTGTPPTSLTLQNPITINGTSVTAGTYLIQGGLIHLSGDTTTPLSGAVLSNTSSEIITGVIALGGVVRIDPSVSSPSAVLPVSFNWTNVNSLQLSDTAIISGTTFSAGTYLVSGGIVRLNTASVPLSGASISVSTAPGVIGGGTTIIGGDLTAVGSSQTLTLSTLNTINSSNLVASGSISLGSSNISLNSGYLTIGSAFTGTLNFPSNFSSATTLVLQRTLSIGGTTIPIGSYPVTDGAIFVNGGIIQLSGSTMTVPTTP